MSDFFVEKNEEEINDISKRPVRNKIPAGYLKINLSSLGKLGFPDTIHVRDYTGEDVLKLSLAREEKFLETLIDVLDSMIYEDFDVELLTEKDLEEIMLNVYLNFWGNYIKDYNFPITDEEWEQLPKDKKERLSSGLESLVIDIDITKIETKPLSGEYKEPIFITDKKGLKVGFRSQRFKDIFVADNYINKKYREEDEKFKKIEKLLEYNSKVELENQKEISLDELEEYKNYIDKKLLDRATVLKSNTIISFDGKKLETVEEKIDVFKQVSQYHWIMLEKVFEKHFKFGVQDEIEMISPLDGKPTKRRCRFQFLDYLPNDRSQDFEGDIVRFGE